MTDDRKPPTRTLSILLWLASGGIVATTMLWVWPFPIELQFMILFVVFAIFTLMKAGYRKPVRPLAFLVGSLLPYVIARLWLSSLGADQVRQKDMPPPPPLSSEQSGK